MTDLHVALVEPEIAWNTGNAGRSCLAAGACLHLIHPLGFVIDDRRVKRAGLDYWPDVEQREWPDVERFEAAWPELGHPVVLSPSAERILWQVDLRRPTLFVFGGESRGLRRALLDRWARHGARLPMQAGRSLNLSTTVGIALWEALRQRAS